MTKEIFVVAYDGEEDDDNVLAYATDRAQKVGAALLLVHVLEWSPYRFLTPDELAERHARRKDEVSRAQAAILDPALKKLTAAGVEATGLIRYGNVVELIVKAAKDSGATMIMVGRSGSGSGSMTERVFGSVPIGLAQVAPVPTVIVP